MEKINYDYALYCDKANESYTLIFNTGHVYDFTDGTPPREIREIRLTDGEMYPTTPYPHLGEMVDIENIKNKLLLEKVKTLIDFEIPMPTIYAYTRKDAIEDGVQIKVPDQIAQEAGFKIPVFITQSVWDGYINPDPDLKELRQDLDGRLWDTLTMCFLAIKSSKTNGQNLFFKVAYLTSEKKHETIKLKVVISSLDIDDSSAAMTIMLPNED